MKKLLASAVLMAAVGLAGMPAHADPTNACVAGDSAGAPVAQDAPLTCTYTATGPGEYVAATPNSYTISVTHNGVTTTAVDSDSLTPPANGTFAAAAGDTVTVTVGPDDAVIATGSVGIVAAHDAA